MAMIERGNPTYARFRETHHALARMFAAGWTISKVSNETGYSRRRLNVILQDPSFQDLVIEKSKSIDEQLDEGADYFYDKYNGAMRRAVDEIYERVDNSVEEMPFRELHALIKDAADRFGYSSKTIRFNVNVGFAEKLDRAIERSGKVQAIEHHPIEKQALPPTPPSPASPPGRSNGFPKSRASLTSVLRRTL